MPRILEILDEATTEAADAREWYNLRSKQAAVAFVQELDLAIRAVHQNPERYPAHRRNTRRYRIGGHFPFAIVYTFDEARVRVIAIAHAKRRPGYWEDRG